MSTKKTSQPEDLDPLVGHNCEPLITRLEPGAQLSVYQGIGPHDELAAILLGMRPYLQRDRPHSSFPLPTNDLAYNLKYAPKKRRVLETGTSVLTVTHTIGGMKKLWETCDDWY